MSVRRQRGSNQWGSIPQWGNEGGRAAMDNPVVRRDIDGYHAMSVLRRREQGVFSVGWASLVEPVTRPPRVPSSESIWSRSDGRQTTTSRPKNPQGSGLRTHRAAAFRLLSGQPHLFRCHTGFRHRLSYLPPGGGHRLCPCVVFPCVVCRPRKTRRTAWSAY